MNIGSRNGGAAGRLSNFTPRPFTFDGVECASMEGLLQSFKFDKPHIQEEICKLTGLAAKKRGQKRNYAWKSQQCLWWKGKKIPRKSDEYQKLLDDAYNAISKNRKFAKDLLSTGDAVLCHSIGRSKPKDTVLTEREFCSRLMKVRDRLQKEFKDLAKNVKDFLVDNL